MSYNYVNKFRRMAIMTGVVCLVCAVLVDLSTRHHFYFGSLGAGCIFIFTPVAVLWKIMRNGDNDNR
jgi:hypothetical protein